MDAAEEDTGRGFGFGVPGPEYGPVHSFDPSAPHSPIMHGEDEGLFRPQPLDGVPPELPAGLKTFPSPCLDPDDEEEPGAPFSFPPPETASARRSTAWWIRPVVFEVTLTAFPEMVWMRLMFLRVFSEKTMGSAEGLELEM
jgi:hypothetical protein